MEAYIVEIEENGKKWYYEHDCYFPTDEPNHRCLIGNLRSAKAKRTKLLRKQPEGNIIRIKKVTMTIGEEVNE